MRGEFTAVKINIITVRKRLCVDGVAQRFGGTACMDTDSTKIGIETAFHIASAGIRYSISATAGVI